MVVSVYFFIPFLIAQCKFIFYHSYATFVNDNVPEAPRSLTFEDFRRGQNPPPDQPIDEDELLRADLLEGDIAGLTRSSFNEIIEEAAVISRDSLLAKSAVRNRYKLWPLAIIPYVVSNKYTSDARAKLAAALMDFHKKTCVRFIHKRATDGDYVYIRPTGGGCYSQGIGRKGGNQPQTLSLDTKCFRHGTIIHELMHAIGFFHEHNRNDRDDYIEVRLQNAIPEDRIQFRKRSLEIIDHLGTRYDYGSVMHYDSFAFSRNGQPTIIAKQEVDIGQRKGFSYLDMKRINLLYQCNGSRPTPDPYQPEPRPTSPPPPPPPPPPTPGPTEIIRNPCYYQIPGTKLLIAVETGCFHVVKYEQNTIIATCQSDGKPTGVIVSDETSVRAEIRRWERRGVHRCFNK